MSQGFAHTLDRTYNAPQHQHRKIDVAQALKMRLKGFTYQAIADKFGVRKQAVCASLKAFTSVLQDTGRTLAYVDCKAEVLDAVEARMVSEMVDPGKLEKASVNNLAYAISQLDHIKRLERGQSTENLDVMAVSASLESIQDNLKALRLAKARLVSKSG